MDRNKQRLETANRYWIASPSCTSKLIRTLEFLNAKDNFFQQEQGYLALEVEFQAKIQSLQLEGQDAFSRIESLPSSTESEKSGEHYRIKQVQAQKEQANLNYEKAGTKAPSM